MPGGHPDSAFSQLRANRRSSRDGLPPNSSRSGYLAGGAAAPEATSEEQRYWTPDDGYHAQQGDIITPGADNFSEAAAGGVSSGHCLQFGRPKPKGQRPRSQEEPKLPTTNLPAGTAGPLRSRQRRVRNTNPTNLPTTAATRTSSIHWWRCWGQVLAFQLARAQFRCSAHGRILSETQVKKSRLRRRHLR